MRLRKTNLDDLPQLKALWALGFGDTEQEIEAFFAISYPTATGFCAEEDGRLIAAAAFALIEPQVRQDRDSLRVRQIRLPKRIQGVWTVFYCLFFSSMP